jgi:hypothetical protein
MPRKGHLKAASSLIDCALAHMRSLSPLPLCFDDYDHQPLIARVGHV